MFKRVVGNEGLTTLHGSNGLFLINPKGVIKDRDGESIPVSSDNDGNQIVYCTAWNGKRVYRVIDLVAIQYKGLYIPEEDYGAIVAFVIDGDKSNTNAENIGYRFKDGLLESKVYPGYYYVPAFTSVVLNREGEAVRHLTGKKVLWSHSKEFRERNIRGGYYLANVNTGNGKFFNVGRHRMLCLTFKPYPDNVDKMVTNHIDGVPGNDSLDNLEWATYSRNISHAYENNLRSDNDPVLVRNVLTGEVKEYFSLAECARRIGQSSHATIFYRLYTSKFGDVFGDGTQVKLKSDTRDWVIPADPDKAIELAKLKIPCISRNCLTGEEKRFDSIIDMVRDIPNANLGAFYYRLTHRVKTPYLGFQVKFEDDEISFASFTEKELELSFVPNSFGVDARNLVTGEQITFSSVRRACERFNKWSLKEHVSKGKQVVLESGWQLKLACQDWEHVENVDEYLYRLRKNVSALNIRTGEITIAATVIKLSEHLRLNPDEVKDAAYTRGAKIYNGFRFRLGVSTEPWPNT